jgi:hypothetical protein
VSLDPEEKDLDSIFPDPPVKQKDDPPATGFEIPGGIDASKPGDGANKLIGKPQVVVQKADSEKANIALKLPCGGLLIRATSWFPGFSQNSPLAFENLLILRFRTFG